MDGIDINNKQKISAYKTVCAKLGLIMCVYYLCRILAGATAYLLLNDSSMFPETFFQYAVRSFISIFFVYIVPLLVTIALFKSFKHDAGSMDSFRELYKKPKRLAKNLGNIAAMYGLGQGVNFLTILVFLLLSFISRKLGGGIEIERFFDQMAVETPQTIPGALIMVFVVAIAAPIIEEFWVRGIIYDALKQFGAGIAILVSSILFGLMHSSINMLFYTTAVGLALGYIRYATGSLYVATVLHMIFNAVAAVLMFIVTLGNMVGEGNAIIETVSSIYLLAMLVLVIAGFAAFIKKIPVIRKYKVENNWSEVSFKKKLTLFLLSVPVLIMLLFAVDAHLNHMFLERIIDVIRG